MSSEQIFHGQKKIFHYIFRNNFKKSILCTKIKDKREIGCEGDVVHSNKFNIKLLVTKKKDNFKTTPSTNLPIISLCWQEMTRNNISPLKIHFFGLKNKMLFRYVVDTLGIFRTRLDGLWAMHCNERCPYPWRRGWNLKAFKVSPTQTILWFCETMKLQYLWTVRTKS